MIVSKGFHLMLDNRHMPVTCGYNWNIFKEIAP